MTLSNNILFPLFILIIIFLFYFNSIINLYINLLTDISPYTHGLSIIILSTALTIKQWIREQKPILLNPSLIGVILLLLSSLGWFLGKIAFIEIIQEFFIVILLIAIIISLYSHNFAKNYYIPIGLLILGLPFWGFLTPFLQHATVASIQWLLSITGITSYIEGIYIHIPEGTFKIAKLCAGMRYQVAALILIILYSYLNNIKLLRTIILIFTISIAAFFANLLRVYIVVISGHLTDMQHFFVTEDHVSLGWFLFAIMMLFFFYTYDRTAKEVYDRKSNCTINNRSSADNISQNKIFYMLIIIALSSGPLLINYYGKAQQHSSGKSLGITTDINDWSIIRNELGTKSPQWTEGDLVYTAQYRNINSSDLIYLFISHFYFQKEGKEAISGVNILYNPEEWETWDESIRQINLNNNLIINVKETKVYENLRLKKKTPDNAQKRLLWSWYMIGDKTVADDYIAKFWNLFNILKGNSEIVVIVISTDFESENNNGYFSARDRLKSFVYDLLYNK